MQTDWGLFSLKSNVEHGVSWEVLDGASWPVPGRFSDLDIWDAEWVRLT
jgi:hypothetical protein